VKARVLLRGLVLIGSLVAVGYAVEVSGLGNLLDTAWIDAQVRGRGAAGELLFVAAGALMTAVGVPRQVVAFLGGYAFGAAFGTLLALVAAVGGCVAAFVYARVMGRSLVASRFPGKIRKVDDFLRDNPFTMTLLIRLLPAGSNLATNLVAGVSSVRAAAFVAGSAVGYVPQTLVFALAGSGVNLEPVTRIGLAAGLFVVSGALGVHLYRRHRHGKSLDDEIEREIADNGEAETGPAPGGDGRPA
jgi:uncharacterized membrane protein YdjX (TVP38/TMEM64 family)